MTQFLESTGKSEAEAIEKALSQLKLDRDDISVEVISRAKVGFLGFGAQPAKVKISYEVPDVKPEPIPEPKPEAKPAPSPVVEPVQTPVVSAPKEEIPVVEVTPVKPEQKEAKPPKEKKPNPSKGPITKAEEEAVINGIRTYLEGLLPLLHVEATPVVSYDGDNFLVNLEGENLGALIGRRGETLDAIQQITGYSVNKICPKRIRIFMDAENYRGKRQETLIKLAEKVAGEAVKHRRNVTLESMNAYERHIIHTALERYPNVSTYSTGSDPNRRTVVAYRGRKKD